MPGFSSQQTYLPTNIIRFSPAAAMRFSLENLGKIVAGFLIFLIALLVAGYFGALWIAFSSEFEARHNVAALDALAQDTRELELRLQEKTAHFADEHGQFLASMEKISVVRYLGEENVAFSGGFQNP
ncbi:MAG: hypothetical protein HY006_02265 [Candidatus Sungbacteria bacterium]|nr:hypothetical protein [Candidatus Sungbacteria bacterium]